MNTHQFENSPGFADKLDQADELAEFQQQFHIPLHESGEKTIYFSGNSLGLQPRSAETFVQQELKDWKKLGVEGHLNALRPWLPYHEFLTPPMAEIVGALPTEVVTMNSLTVNLHLLLVSFYQPYEKRRKVLIESKAFPSDRYAVQSQLRFHSNDPINDLMVLKPDQGDIISTEGILDSLDRQGEEIALILIGGVNYYTGQAFDMQAITQAAHNCGCLVGFDLAHAAGNIPLHLHDWGVDFAVWCSYKYLNSGPGAPGGVFIHERHHKRNDLSRFEGWWGHNKQTRFQMPEEFQPMKSAEAWQISNPPILGMAPLLASLNIFQEVGMEKLRKKSIQLTAWLEYLLQAMKSDLFNLLTPEDPQERGCQLSLQLTQPKPEVMTRLRKKGVVCDWREPNVIRAAPVPLYNSYRDGYQFVEIFKEVLTG